MQIDKEILRPFFTQDIIEKLLYNKNYFYSFNNSTYKFSHNWSLSSMEGIVMYCIIDNQTDTDGKNYSCFLISSSNGVGRDAIYFKVFDEGIRITHAVRTNNILEKTTVEINSNTDDNNFYLKSNNFVVIPTYPTSEHLFQLQLILESNFYLFLTETEKILYDLYDILGYYDVYR